MLAEYNNIGLPPPAALRVGKVSLTVTLVSVVPVFGLLMFRVTVDAPPTPTVPGENDLVIAGGATTVRVAVLLTAPVPAEAEVVVTPVVVLL